MHVAADLGVLRLEELLAVADVLAREDRAEDDVGEFHAVGRDAAEDEERRRRVAGLERRREAVAQGRRVVPEVPGVVPGPRVQRVGALGPLVARRRGRVPRDGGAVLAPGVEVDVAALEVAAVGLERRLALGVERAGEDDARRAAGRAHVEQVDVGLAARLVLGAEAPVGDEPRHGRIARPGRAEEQQGQQGHYLGSHHTFSKG